MMHDSSTQLSSNDAITVYPPIAPPNAMREVHNRIQDHGKLAMTNKDGQMRITIPEK